MKLYQKISNTNLIRFCVLGVFSLGLLASCDKNSNAGDAADSGAAASLSIQVEGIDNEIGIDPKAIKASNSKSSSQLASGVLEEKDVTYKEFDAIVRLQEDQVAGDRTVSNNQVAKGTAGKTATKALAMDPGIKYRLLLYKDGKFVTSVHAQSGVASHVEVVKGEAYSWYAYSYNTTDNIPDVANPAAPVIESAVDKPLLYASGTVTVTGAGNVDKPLLVRFAHRTSKIGAELSARGMFAGFESITANFAGTDYIQKGSLNVLTGQYESMSAVDVGNLVFTNYSVKTKDTIKVASYYTAAQTPIPAMTVNVQSFTIKLDKVYNGVGNRTFSTPFQFSMDLPDMTWGHRLTSAMDLIESAVTVNGIRWSRANLYFSEADRAYRFRHQIEPIYGRVEEEYWNFKAPFPNGTIGGQDPCTRVYPLGKWKMPNRDETSRLISQDQDGVNRQLTGDYVEYVATGTAAPYPSNKMRVNKMGYFHVIGGIFGVNEDGSNGYFWTSETGFLGGALTGVYTYRVSDDRKNGIFGGDYVWEHVAASSWGGTLNTRCIRK